MQSVEVPKPLLHFPLLPWICTTFHSTTATNNFRCSFDNRGTRAKRTRRLVQATRRVPHKLLTEIELVAPLVPVGDGGTVYGCAGLSSGVFCYPRFKDFPCACSHAWNLSIPNGFKSVHPIGHPISHSVHSGFIFPPA